MDADRFFGPKIASVDGAFQHSQIRCSVFLLHAMTNNMRRALHLYAVPPSRPPIAEANPPPSYALVCKFREITSTNTSTAAFGERECKLYSAKDVASGLVDVLGWSVETDGKGQMGKVAEIIHVGRSGAREHGTITPYEYLLKVVRPLSGSEESDQRSLTTGAANLYDQLRAREIKLLIPIVNEFIQHIDPVKKQLLVKPPAELLELAARSEAIANLRPEIQLFCKRYANFLKERFIGNKNILRNGDADYDDIVCSYMPTRKQMFAVGRADLVQRINAAGGILHVANALGLKTTRRPNGFGDLE